MKLIITIDTDDRAANIEKPYTANITLDGEPMFDEAMIGESLEDTLFEVGRWLRQAPPAEAAVLDSYNHNSSFGRLVDSAAGLWRESSPEHRRGQAELIRATAAWKVEPDQADEQIMRLIELLATTSPTPEQ